MTGVADGPVWGHVPIPFGTATSSLLTVIRALGREHDVTGGRTRVALSHNRDARLAPEWDVLVDYTTHCPREWFTRREQLVDHVIGGLGVDRPYGSRLFLPAVEGLRAAGVDAVLVHEGHLATSGLRHWRRGLPDVPVVLYVHTRPSRSYGRRELRRLVDAADAVVTVSQAARDDLLTRLGRDPRGPVAVVHNGFDDAVFSARGRRPRVAGQPLRVTFAGEVAPYKGVHCLIEAVASAGAPIELTVVGSRPQGTADSPLSDYETSLRELADARGVRVTFVPRVGQARLADLLREADVVAVPSLFDEPFGMIAREAMACGAAVVCSRRGGLPEAGGDCATFVDPENVAEFAAALDAFADPAVLANAQQAGLDWVAGRSWATSYRQVRDLVDTVTR